MGDGEIDLSNHLMSPNPDSAGGFDEFLTNTTTCTHTHTCNPPGPSAAAHTHTCYHTHTQVFSASEDEGGLDERKKARKPSGNREAVRKYREKKKAHVAYLEEEVKKLRSANQQLLRRLQGQAELEAEVGRLRSLLVGVRARIDGELGVYPFQKQCDASGLRCSNNAPCIGENAHIVDWEGSCIPAVVECQLNSNGAVHQVMEFIDPVNSRML